MINDDEPAKTINSVSSATLQARLESALILLCLVVSQYGNDVEGALQKNYVLDGYSICDSSAGNLFSMFDYRKQVITYFVKCIIYYAVKAVKGGNNFEEIIKSLKQMGR